MFEKSQYQVMMNTYIIIINMYFFGGKINLKILATNKNCGDNIFKNDKCDVQNNGT